MRSSAQVADCHPAGQQAASEEHTDRLPWRVLPRQKFQTVHEGGAGRAGERKASPVEAADGVFALVSYPAHGEDNPRQTQRYVEKEDPTPGGIRRNETSRGRPEDRSY